MNKNFLMLAVSVAVLSLGTVTAKADEEILNTPARDYTLQDLDTRLPDVSTTSNRTNLSGNSFSNYLAGLGNSAAAGAGLSRSGSAARGGPTLSEYREFAESKIQETVGSRGGSGLGGLFSDPMGYMRDRFNQVVRDAQGRITSVIDRATGLPMQVANGLVRDAQGRIVGAVNQATGQISSVTNGLVRNATGGITGVIDNAGNITNVVNGFTRNPSGQITSMVNQTTGQITNVSDGFIRNASGAVTGSIDLTTGQITNIAGTANTGKSFDTAQTVPSVPDNNPVIGIASTSGGADSQLALRDRGNPFAASVNGY